LFAGHSVATFTVPVRVSGGAFDVADVHAEPVFALHVNYARFLKELNYRVVVAANIEIWRKAA